MTGHEAIHARTVAAPADAAYALVADVTRWPVLFGPTIHVEHLERGAGTERFRLWALVGGEVRSWTSRRWLDPSARRIRFEQEHSSPPVAAMGGDWDLLAADGGTTEVVLRHRFRVVDDDPAAAERIQAALDRNSGDELAALARVAEAGAPVDELVFAFEDTVALPAEPADAYAFVDRADRWPERLPHVGRVDLTETASGVQDMEMDTVTAGGRTHTTRSIRLCFPERGVIVYKQLVAPALLFGHSGSWTFSPAGDGGTLVTARHLVAVDPAAVEGVLGAGTTLGDARRYVRDALGANSRTTLAAAGSPGTSPVGTPPAGESAP